MKLRYVVITIAAIALVLYMLGFVSIITQRRETTGVNVDTLEQPQQGPARITVRKNSLEEENEELRRQLAHANNVIQKFNERPKAFPLPEELDNARKTGVGKDTNMQTGEVMVRNNDHSDPLSVGDHEELYWHQYGRDQHFQKCEYDFGFPLINRWRKAKKTYCSPLKGEYTTGTEINCNKIHQTSHTADDYYCYAKNLYVDTSKLTDFSFPPDSLFGYCKRESIWDQDGNFQLYLANLMRGLSPKSPQEGEKKCSQVLQGRTVIIERDGASNLFHSFSDVINLFYAILIHTKGAGGEDMKNNRLIFFDNASNGPFWDIWSLFGGRGIYRLSEFKNKYPNEIICLEDGLFGIPGGSNFIWKDAWKPNPCYHSSLLKAFVRYILSEWKIPQHRHRMPDEPIRILFSSRKHKPNAKIGRKIVNEDKLVEVMKEKLFTISTGKQIPVNITRIDFGQISFREQVSLVRQTDIFLGMHGAGMTHTLWLHEESVVVELFPKGWHQSTMRNISKWLGRTYLSWQNVHDKHVADREHLWTHVEENEFLDVMRAAIKIVQGFHLGSGVDHLHFKNGKQAVKDK